MAKSADDVMNEWLASTGQHRVECSRCDKEWYEKPGGGDETRVCASCADG